MGTNGASALKYTTTCRLCGHQIIDHPLNVQIVGQPDARAQNLLAALMKHLEKKHKDAWMQIQGLWQFFLGFLCFRAPRWPAAEFVPPTGPKPPASRFIVT